ncbi:hypothetical protein PENSPDRAFT_327297 [Peniophora sp. CONT]|nr:hypothetical protein PENSPDRAFT_327297 [Peniophora sp. CONT]
MRSSASSYRPPLIQSTRRCPPRQQSTVQRPRHPPKKQTGISFVPSVPPKYVDPGSRVSLYRLNAVQSGLRTMWTSMSLNVSGAFIVRAIVLRWMRECMVQRIMRTGSAYTRIRVCFVYSAASKSDPAHTPRDRIRADGQHPFASSRQMASTVQGLCHRRELDL